MKDVIFANDIHTSKGKYIKGEKYKISDEEYKLTAMFADKEKMIKESLDVKDLDKIKTDFKKR